MYKKFLSNISAEALRVYQVIMAEYNFDLGDEFELALCKFLRLILPTKYCICRGFIVDKNDAVIGDDIIIYDGSSFPRLRLIDDFTVKQFVPYDAVYAYIEAKHHLNSQSLKKAFEQCGNVKKLFRDRRELSEMEFGNIGKTLQVKAASGWPEYRNPIYTAIIGRQTNIKNSSALANHITEHGMNCNAAHMPDLIVVGNQFVCLPTISDNFESPFIIPTQTTNLNVIQSESSIGIGICALLLALNYIKLRPIDYKQLMAGEINTSYETTL